MSKNNIKILFSYNLKLKNKYKLIFLSKAIKIKSIMFEIVNGESRLIKKSILISNTKL